MLSRHDDTTLLLDSPRFAEGDLSALYDEMNQLMQRLTGLAHLFHPGRPYRFSVRQITESVPAGGAASKQIMFRVVSAPPEDLGMDSDGNPLPCKLYDACDVDDAVDKALRLLRDDEITWPALYDVMEFLESARIPFGALGWIGKTEWKHIGRTANYHRHAGDPRRSLPTSRPPPTLAEAREAVVGLLRRWLIERIA